MYGDLRSKLELYKSSQGKKTEARKDSGLDIQNIIDGSVCTNEFGTYFVTEKRYPLTYMHGGCCIGQAEQMNLLSLKSICDGLGDNVAIKDFLFLDTETTGLSSGAGTVAFLIGTAFFTEDAFILRQYFMRDYNEECALLNDLNRLFSSFKGLITFNGKSFDWNILLSRFAFNKIKNSLEDPLHIDLLHPSRRIWKLKLESCRLSVLEEHILCEYRTDDIPGAMIPSVYFKYLDDRNASDLKRVIMHNELDILSMVSLMIRILRMLENPLFETDGERELLGLGRIFENSQDYGKVVDCYEACIKSDSAFVKESASRRLGDIYKKNKEYKKAAEHWERMIYESRTLSLYPLIELAKHYEHKEKDIDRALQMVEKAMELVLRMGLKNSAHFYELKKRYERLKKKSM